MRELIRSERALILAPHGRDADVAGEVLRFAGIAAKVCAPSGVVCTVEAPIGVGS